MPEVPPQPTQPTQPQVQQEPKKSISWKKIVVTGVVIAIVAGTIALLIWFFVLNKPESTTTETTRISTPSAKQATPSATATPSAQKDETVNWKTYTHPSNDYSIKYPADWLFEPLGQADGPRIRNFDASSKPAEDPPTKNYPKGYINLRIFRLGPEVGFSDNPIDVNEWYSNLGTPSQITISEDAQFDMTTLKDYSLNGLPGKRVKDSFTEVTEVILIPHGKYVYEISIYPYGGSLDNTVKTILSTFKFLPSQ